MPQARVNFIPETNTRILGLTGYIEGSYGSSEARLALAIEDVGGGGGSSVTTPADIASGIDSSTDIDTLLTNLAAIEVAANNLDLDIGDSSSEAGDPDVIGLLKDINAKASGNDANTFTEFSGSATDTDSLAVAANINATELNIQNKSTSQFLYIRLGSVASESISYVLPPLAVFSFDGVLSRQELHVLADTGETTDYYGMRVGVLILL